MDDDLLLLALVLGVLYVLSQGGSAAIGPMLPIPGRQLPIGPAPAPPTADGCVTMRPALTPLDDGYMLAAFTASFRGLFGRDPSMQPGSGSDDGWYWIGVSNHHGAFSDNICRAGWSAYWEEKLAGNDNVPSELADQPARFQP